MLCSFSPPESQIILDLLTGGTQKPLCFLIKEFSASSNSSFRTLNNTNLFVYITVLPSLVQQRKKLTNFGYGQQFELPPAGRQKRPTDLRSSMRSNELLECDRISPFWDVKSSFFTIMFPSSKRTSIEMSLKKSYSQKTLFTHKLSR